MMHSQSFQARVVNGQLVPAEALRPFEGKQVRVTLEAPALSQVPSSDFCSNEEEPPENLDVERDIYVPMPRRVEILEDARVHELGPRQPFIILPEELADE